MRELRGDTQTSVITTVETNNNVFVFECNVNVTIPNSVTIISDSAFLNCKKLENVQFMQSTDAKSSIKSIGNSAFQGCVALKSIGIPDSVETIGENAFNGCTALTKVYIPISVANKLKIQKGNGIVFFGATVTVEYYYTD